MESAMNEERNAKLLLLLVIVIWGLNVVMIKFLAGHFDPLMLAALRIGAASALLAAVVWKSHGFARLSKKEWGLTVGIAFSGIFIHQWTISAGLKTIPASTGSLILGLNPLVTAVLAYLIFREPLNLRKVLALVLGFAGVLLVIYGDARSHAASIAFGLGEGLVVIAMLTYVISGLFIKKAVQTQPVMVITAYSHLVATVFLVPAALMQEAVRGVHRALPDDWFVWGVLLFSAWVATALCTIWWNGGIRIIGAGRTAMFLNGMPVMSLFFAVLMLGETMTWLHGAGFLTVFFAVWLGTMQIKSKAKAELPPIRETA